MTAKFTPKPFIPDGKTIVPLYGADKFNQLVSVAQASFVHFEQSLAERERRK